MSSDLYSRRGVSAQKEDVHNATKELDKGLYPSAFCKVYPDYLNGDSDYVNLIHADGAGTKSVIAYIYWKETGDISVWEGIAIDAIVMNLDDLLCVGVTDNLIFSSTIGRNKMLIPAEVLDQLINGSQRFFDKLKEYGIHIHFLGGETADIGDSVRTIVVDGTMASRAEKNTIISNENIQAGNVLVSFASFGQANWESEYNSGIGSNGLTSARHDLLSHVYYKKYPECVNPDASESVMYQGKYLVEDSTTTSLNVGKLLLSPTRTYAPLVKKILSQLRNEIYGMIHNTGGGQTKVLHYLPDGLHVVKDNLIPHPPIFDMIQSANDTSWKEMYEVFNMGNRLEIYTNHSAAVKMIEMALSMGIEAQISGYVESGDGKTLTIKSPLGKFQYQK